LTSQSESAARPDALIVCSAARLTDPNRRIEQIEVIQEGPVKIDPIGSFDTAGLHPAMLKNVELSGFDAPTPIQKFTLPAILQGYDVIGIAQTGG